MNSARFMSGIVGMIICLIIFFSIYYEHVPNEGLLGFIVLTLLIICFIETIRNFFNAFKQDDSLHATGDVEVKE